MIRYIGQNRFKSVAEKFERGIKFIVPVAVKSYTGKRHIFFGNISGKTAAEFAEAIFLADNRINFFEKINIIFVEQRIVKDFTVIAGFIRSHTQFGGTLQQLAIFAADITFDKPANFSAIHRVSYAYLPVILGRKQFGSVLAGISAMIAVMSKKRNFYIVGLDLIFKQLSAAGQCPRPASAANTGFTPCPVQLFEPTVEDFVTGACHNCFGKIAAAGTMSPQIQLIIAGNTFF